MILLDTDILIDVFRKHPPAVAWINSIPTQKPARPGFVAMELLAGCYNKRDIRIVQQRIQNYAVLWPDPANASSILPTFASAHLTHSLGILDALIAATALTHNLPLHTFNQKHFAAVPGLQTIQPYVR
ncbi:MAG: PIN domain-containing protein [Phycisphaerae bacterium]